MTRVTLAGFTADTKMYNVHGGPQRSSSAAVDATATVRIRGATVDIAPASVMLLDGWYDDDDYDNGDC